MFARWNLPKVAEKVITSVKPGTKFKGQKTVGQVQSDAQKSKLKMTKENLEQTFKKTDKNLKKLTETTRKTRKSLRDYLLNK